MDKPTAKDIEHHARELWERPYSRVVVREDNGAYSAKVLELPGCFAEGDTPAEVHENLEATALAWLQDELEKGESIPEPQPEHEYSGRFLLRLPRSLHARAAHHAARENVSLNHFISTAVAEKVTSGTVALCQVLCSFWLRKGLTKGHRVISLAIS